MATVTKGAKTTTNSGGKPPAPKVNKARNGSAAAKAKEAEKEADSKDAGGDDDELDAKKPSRGSAKAIREKVNEDALDRPTYFTATTGGLQVKQPRPLLDGEGKKYGEEPGLYLDFNDAGMSRPLYPAKYPADKQLIDAVEAFIEQDPRTAQKIRLTKRGDLEAMPPFAKWDEWNAATNLVALQANFTDDHESNQHLIRDAARYETENQNRDKVLAALDALLASEIASDTMETDSLEVTI